MTCRDVVALVTAYLEGAMTDDERLRFEEHLALCDGCATYVRQIQRTIDLLGEVHEAALSPLSRTTLIDAFADWSSSGSTET